MNILITGGSGFIGARLVEALAAENHRVTVLSRRNLTAETNVKYIRRLNEISGDADFDVVINLAGAPIASRWTEKYKKELIESRIGTTAQLADLVRRSRSKPKCMLSASAIGYYGAQADRELDETSRPEREFTHDLCRQWEAAAMEISELGVRLVIMRLGVVLGKGGALEKMLPAFRLGLGGRIGSGRQYMSWIHIEDVTDIMMKLMQDPSCEGVYNLTAPNPVSNRYFSKALGKTLSRPAWLPMPGIIVKILFGEMGERLLLHGQRVLPGRLAAAGYRFHHETIESALAASLNTD